MTSSSFGLPNVTINVNLQYVQLKSFDTDQITGSLLDHFTASYDESTNILLFEQSSDIPGDWFGSVEFPLDVTKNSNLVESYNGFNVNISAVDSNTRATGSASAFTYTDSSLTVVENDALIFQVSPNPTSGIINIKLDGNSDTKVEIFDLLGKKILTKEFNKSNNVSLNIERLESAIYFLKVTSSNGTENTVKVVKE